MEMFDSNQDVAFGDVNLAETSIRGSHNPGAGGWPTIRYFNKETGYDGGSYVKKTDDAMCTELGKEDNMQAYIEEYGKTSMCDPVTAEGCDTREKAFVSKFIVASETEVDAQLERLKGMGDKKMTSSLKKWVNKRVTLLHQVKRAQARQSQKTEL